MDVTILDDRVLIKPIKEDKTTLSGLIIAGNNNENTPTGTVVNLGEGRKTKEGVLIAPEVKINDVVMYPEGKGIPVTIDGQSLLVLKEEEILGVVEQH